MRSILAFVQWPLLNSILCVGNSPGTADVPLNENLTMVSYDIVMSVIERIRGMKWYEDDY
jgi:hypothetical protein